MLFSDAALNPFVLGALAEFLVERDADVERILLNTSTPDSDEQQLPQKALRQFVRSSQTTKLV